MRTVETAALESADDKCVAARSEEGIAVNVAAAPAAPRNLRREMKGIFMGTGKYSGKGLKRDGGFHSLKTSSLPRGKPPGGCCGVRILLPLLANSAKSGAPLFQSCLTSSFRR